MRYLITPGIAALCYVTDAEDERMMPWHGVSAIYMGEGNPIQYQGPFALPPAVQQSLAEHFAGLFSLEVMLRAEKLPKITPWVVEVSPPVSDAGARDTA